METETINRQQIVFYTVVHKLTNKPIRNCNLNKYEILQFKTMQDAQEICDLKNKIMGADFYKVVTMYREIQQ